MLRRGADTFSCFSDSELLEPSFVVDSGATGELGKFIDSGKFGEVDEFSGSDKFHEAVEFNGSHIIKADEFGGDLGIFCMSRVAKGNVWNHAGSIILSCIWLGFSAAKGSDSATRNAGFSWLRDTLRCWPPRSIVKYFG